MRIHLDGPDLDINDAPGVARPYAVPVDDDPLGELTLVRLAVGPEFRS